MNFCVIGLGWGKNYIRNLESLQQHISCICSRNQASLPGEFKKYKHVTNYLNINLNEVDVACICTPPGLHYEIARYFILNNKHVIVEKPFVFSIEQAIELKELAISTGVSVLIAYQYLWNEDYLNCVDKLKGKKGAIIIENKIIGNVKRSDYSFLWDYASHELAMAFNIVGVPGGYIIEGCKQKDDEYNYMLSTGNFTITSNFLYNASDKLRLMHITTNGLSVLFEDTYKYNALMAMLSAFIRYLEEKIMYSNIDLAIVVTRVLTDLENL